MAVVFVLTSCKTNKTVTIAINCNNNKDTVYIVKQELEFSEVYTLYHCDKKIYEINTQDGSSIEYEYHYKDKTVDYDCYSLYNNSADCTKYLFFNRKNNLFYITVTCFSGFYPEKQMINFEKQSLVLYNTYQSGYETVILKDDVLFVPYSNTIRNITGKIMFLHQNNKQK